MDLAVNLGFSEIFHVFYSNGLSWSEREPPIFKCGWLPGYKDVKNTVDGAEIRRSPVQVGSLSRYGIYTSQVVQDFIHEEYSW